MLKKLFKLGETPEEELEKAKWKKRRQKKKCEGKNWKDCEIPIPEKTQTYTSEQTQSMLKDF